MTSPTSVGEVSIEIVGEIRNLAKNIRKQVADGLKGIDKLVRDAAGDVTVPVRADTNTMRSSVAAAVRAAQSSARIQVPIEPGDRAGFEAKLRTQLAAVASRVKQTVTVDVDVNGGRGGGAVAGVANMFKGLTSSVPIIGRVSSAVADLIGSTQKLAGTSAQMGGSIAGAFSSAAGPIGALVAAVTVAAGAVAVFTTALALAVPVLGTVAAGIVALAGAAAALPGALAGIGAAVSTLSLGFKGISEAFKPQSGGGGGGGGSAGNQARQIAAASRAVEAARRGITAANRQLAASERALASAQRGVLAAERQLADAYEQVADAQKQAALSQQAVNRARREAKEDIEDLNRALRGAQLSEQEATLAVTDALRELNAAKLTGNIPEIQRAELAYQRAQLSLEDATDTVGDLQEETDEANAKGVEGSDKVQDALRDQADAYDAVKDAQRGVLDAQNGIIDAADALKSAQDGVLSAQDGIKAAYDGLASAQDSLAQAQTKVAAGAGGVGREITKLAPAAQKFVNAVKALRPAFESLRLDVQQKLFQGLDKTVTKVGEAWIPALRTTLGNYATTFNGFFKNLGSAITTPKFIEDLQIGAEGARKGMQSIGDAITASLVPAFGGLARASGPFLADLGEKLGGVITKFSNWILEAEKSGKLEDFFTKTAEAMGDIIDTGEQVGRLIGNIIRILLDGNGKNDKSAVDSFNDGLRSINAWLEDPENKKKIAEFGDSLKGLFEGFKEAYDKAKPWIDKLVDPTGGDTTLTEDAGRAIGAALVAGLKEGVKQWLSMAVDNWKEQFLNGPYSPVAWIRKALGIKSPSTVMMAVGRDLVQGLIQGINDKLSSLLGKAREIPSRIIEGIGGLASTVKQKGRDTLTGMITGIGERFPGLRQRAGEIRTNVQNTLRTSGEWLRANGHGTVGGLMTGIADRLPTLSARAGQMRGVVSRGFGNAGSILGNAGRAVVDGLMAGIWSRIPNLGQQLGDIGRYIRDNKGPIEKDRVLLVPAGRAIMAGLISGIADRKSALAAELADVTGIVAGTSLPSLGADMDATISRSLQVADSKTIEAYWRSGSSGDPVLDGLRDMIGFRFRGDVQAALGS